MTRRVAVGAMLFFFATPALGHTIADPRVVVLVAKPGALEVRVNELTQPGEESAALRRRYDGDRDGKIDDSEASDLASFLVARSLTNLRVWQDGKPLALKEQSRALKGIASGVGSSDSLSIDVVLTTQPVVAAGGHVKVTLGDWRPDGHAVRVAVLAQDGVVLAKTTLGSLESEGQVATGIALEQASSEQLEYDLPAKTK